MTLTEQLAAVEAALRHALDAPYKSCDELATALALLPGLREGIQDIEQATATRCAGIVGGIKQVRDHEMIRGLERDVDDDGWRDPTVVERAAFRAAAGAIRTEYSVALEGIRTFAQDEQEKLILHQRGEIAAMTTELGELRGRLDAAERQRDAVQANNVQIMESAMKAGFITSVGKDGTRLERNPEMVCEVAICRAEDAEATAAAQAVRVAELEAALRAIADSRAFHQKFLVLPVIVQELQQIARAALQPRTAEPCEVRTVQAPQGGGAEREKT